MGCGTSKNGDVREPVLRTASAPLGLQESRTADAEPIRRSASAQPASGSAQRGLGEAAGEAGNIAIHHHVVSSGTVVINVSEAQQACTRHEDGETTAAAVQEGGSGESLDGIGVQVFSQCADIRNGASGESEQGLKQFASALASCAEGAFTMLDSFGPVGPLFKALGMFMHFVGKVQSAQGEGQRLQLWAETLIPIIRQSVPKPFPADLDPLKRQELVQCAQQAVAGIEVLQTAIKGVDKSRESWFGFFRSGRYIDMMQEAKTRVETAIDLIQKHLIIDTKNEVFKITAMLKTHMWGDLTNMNKGVEDVKSNLATGFAEIRTEFKNVNIKLDNQDEKLDKQDEKLSKILDIVAHCDIKEPVLTHATIPPEVPELPAAFQPRPALLAEIKQRVLTQASCTTAVVGVSRNAAATTSAQGMGGVGKTTVAVQLIRDPEVGHAFKRLLWVSVSQEPDMLHLLGRLYFQLKSIKLPASAEGELDAVQLVKEAARGIKVLLVLDDCWEEKHAKLLNCVDPEAGSACVITTRIRRLVDGEISCGLLSAEESLLLLLRSAGLDHLVDNPPAAAIAAVECCGRLALALPIAGGMIRELADVWETDLVPLLKGELSEELSVENSIVNASFRCLENSQRAGAEALFSCFGCFAEDEVVPAAALDLLAPIVCERAGITSASKLKVRKWLGLLLKGSLLSGSTTGVSVHDLVRDVMMTRAEAAQGGMVGLQREVLRLFLEAYDSSDRPLKTFILRSIKHHVAQAQQSNVPLHADELIMRILNHNVSVLCARAVAGIGVQRMQEIMISCEARGEWWLAAQLWFAASTLHGLRAGVELKRARAAISHVQPETEQSRGLEGRILTGLIVCGNGYGVGTPESSQVTERMGALGQQALQIAASKEHDLHTPDVAKYEMLISTALSQFMEAMKTSGCWGYTVLTPEALSQAYVEFVEAGNVFGLAAKVAPDLARRSYAANNLPLFGLVLHPRLHFLPEFDKKVIAGESCSELRNNIEAYDFEFVHAECKSTGVAADLYLYQHNEVGVLLWSGDVETAKAGWQKQIEARKQIQALVQKGERTWSEYLYEEVMIGPMSLFGGLLAAGEIGMVRELIPHTLIGIALRDPLVMSEMETMIRDSMWTWQGPDGYCFWRVETMTLLAHALAAVADDGEVDVLALRAWLPRPDELIYIAEHEFLLCAFTSGASHPALLCATVYATRLGAWTDAEAIVNGVLAIPPMGDGKGFGMQPLVRIEAWRLLARCRGACGYAAGACEALENAASESRAVGYVWMEAASLRDMLEWIEGEAQTVFVQTRIDTVTSNFLIGKK